MYQSADGGRRKMACCLWCALRPLVSHFGKVFLNFQTSEPEQPKAGLPSNGSWIYRKIWIVTANFVPFTYNLVQQIATDLKVLLSLFFYFRNTFLLFYTLMSYRKFLQNTLLKQKEKRITYDKEIASIRNLCVLRISLIFSLILLMTDSHNGLVQRLSYTSLCNYDTFNCLQKYNFLPNMHGSLCSTPPLGCSVKNLMQNRLQLENFFSPGLAFSLQPWH